MTCSICGSIQDFARANTGRDQHFEPPITSLKGNGISSDDDLRECPECDAVFHWHDDTAQTGSGNNDEEVLTRLPAELTPFVRAFLHRGERPAADVAQDAGRLLELPDVVRQLLLTHVLRHDRELTARLVPWMLDEISQRDPDWAGGFVRSFASGDDAARLMSELSLRPPSPALEKLRAHCKEVLCSVCPTVLSYRRTIARRDRPPPPLDALVQLGASDEVDVWECPECDSMFIWETKHGDEGSLIRQSELLASALRACVHRTGVVPDADKELVFACNVPKVVLAHGMRRDRELVRQLVPCMISALARFEHPWLHEILCDFVDGERSDAKVVLDAIEKTSRTNPLVEAVAARCRQRGGSKREIDPVADWDAFESALAKMTNEDAWSELERVIETLTAKEAWKDLESVMRRAIRLITGFAGTRIGAREKADVEHDLWKRLGLLYSHRLDAKDSALVALEMAVKHRADDDETHLALAALREQAGHLEPAIRSNEGRESRILAALLDPAGPPLTVGALEAALGMQLGPSILPASGLGLLSTTNVSVKYGWHFTGGAVTTLEDLRARSLVEWSATFAQGSAATDAALRERFGPPRELPSGRGRVFGPWILVPAARGQACTLSWYAKLPDWAVPPADAARRQRALFELATALTTAETIADLASTLSSLPNSCGLVHAPESVAERSASLEFVPPIGASELARIFGWRDAVGQTFDMHMQTWVVRVVTGQAAYGPETELPTIASWSVTATLDGPPSGDEWVQPIPSESGPPFVFKRPGGTRRFASPDVVRFIKFG